MEENVLTMIKAKSVNLSAQTLKGEMFYVPFSFGTFKRCFQSKAAAATLCVCVCECVCMCACECVCAHVCVHTCVWLEGHFLYTDRESGFKH